MNDVGTNEYFRDEIAEKRANEAISKDCTEIGVKIDSPWDLVGKNGDDLWSMEIAKIFARHLHKPYPPFVLEGLILAGCCLETRDIFLEPVLKIIKENGNNYLGQIATNGLLRMAIASDEIFIRDLILDKSIGVSRSLMVEGYAKLAKQRAVIPLRTLVSDPEVRSNVLKALSKLGDQSIRGELQILATHEDSYHRKIARDALARLDKKASKGKSKNLN